MEGFQIKAVFVLSSSIWKSKTGSVGFENQHVLDYSVEANSWFGAFLNHVYPKLILHYLVFNIFIGCFQWGQLRVLFLLKTNAVMRSESIHLCLTAIFLAKKSMTYTVVSGLLFHLADISMPLIGLCQHSLLASDFFFTRTII